MRVCCHFTAFVLCEALESCPNNNILQGTHCSLSVKREHWAEFMATASTASTAEAWHGRSAVDQGPQLAIPHCKGWLDPPVDTVGGGGTVVDVSVHDCTDPLNSSVDVSFSYLFLPTVCSLLCHPCLPASFLSLIRPALLANYVSMKGCTPTVASRHILSRPQTTTFGILNFSML